MMRRSNYDITRDRLEHDFLAYDQSAMLRRFALRHDEAYIYLTFLRRPYRIDRHTGRVEWSSDGFLTAHHAGLDAVGTIFDYLCCARDGAVCSGEYVTVNQLPGVIPGTTLGNDLYQPHIDRLSGRGAALARACETLGGTPEPVGDVAYRIPLLLELDLLFQFWDADEDFVPVVKIKWDKNVLSFLRYETTYYAVSQLWTQLEELL